MTAAEAETATEDERRTSSLELFFDLVVVFAITQVTTLIVEDPSAAGFARGALVLALVWWAWSAYAWMTNAIDIERTFVRALFLVGAAGVFFMALAVPRAYQDEGLWFAVPYVFVRTLNVVLYLWGLRGTGAHFKAFRGLAPWFLVAPAFVLAGGFAHGSARPALWLVSLGIDMAGALLTGADNDFQVSPAHFAERYALFVIIALGESVVAIGVAAAGLRRDAAFAASVVVAGAGVAALWWAYFDFTSTAAERKLRLTAASRRAPLARDIFTFFHYPIVLGVILYAVAAKKTLAHPDAPLSAGGRWALGLGLALFLFGFALVRFRAVRRIAWERLTVGVAILVTVALVRDARAIALLAAAVSILAAGLTLEAFRLRDVRAQLRA